MNTKAYSNWITDQWEVALGRFEGTIPGCPHSTRLILDWKHVLSQIKWSGRSSLNGNSLRKESLHWSAVFPFPLAVTQPVKAYNLMKMGIRRIEDVVDENGCVLSFPRVCQKLNLGMHHRPIWRDICALLAPLIPIPILNEEDRLKDWELIGNSPGSKPVSMQNLTSRQIYRAIVPPPWIQSHGNLLWHMHKSMRWWKMVLSISWKSKLPLKQRVFLWRCMLGILPVGKILASHRIASSSCRRCSN
ncbi:hypothetical protein GOP47_0012229 [Adiantum capillus-veneris]|uniref:Reverse transcriptase zinc-binding domain-containing protein n=1 Tax=Adiantum capillus-veneris TaxID=13818 RepID=A0A9D4URN1_ADICA|nr:hypothetical protein GOP47_0012229 [Adiantum capillus-veneris]